MRNLSNAMVLRTTLVKLGIRPIVNILMACSDLCATHQSKLLSWDTSSRREVYLSIQAMFKMY
jgi:hypothetical protein